MPNITLDEVVQQFLINVMGKLEACAGGTTLGQIAVRSTQGLYVFPLELDGTYNFQVGFNCLNFPVVEITGYDLDNKKQTILQSFISFSDIDLGDQMACEDLEDFVELEIDGTNYLWTPTEYYFDVNTPEQLHLDALTVGGELQMVLPNFTGIGTYATSSGIMVESINTAGQAPNYLDRVQQNNSFTFDITTNNGSIIEGSLDGFLQDGGGPLMTSGNFKIKRSSKTKLHPLD